MYESAALAALEAFGIEPAALAAPHASENVTFKVVDAGNGEVYALRLHRPGYQDISALQSEGLWTRALAAHGVNVPVQVASADGEYYVEVAVGTSADRRWASVTKWIDGEVLIELMGAADAAAKERHFEALGASMAALHNHASDWMPPLGFKRHSLDAEGLMGDHPFWGKFWEHAGLTRPQRRMLLTVRDDIRSALDRLERRPEIYSVIHADLHAGNVLVAGEQLAIIDFDDCAFGWHLYDVAVALFLHQADTDFIRMRDACIRGYRRRRPLPDEALAMLPMFLLIRDLGLIGWTHQRPEISTGVASAAYRAAVCARAENFKLPG